ncbi:hypothetical protein HUS96_32910, partial [Pseudomonas protegens]|nr:hypothetical protein [Pseudomonas protegens]
YSTGNLYLSKVEDDAVPVGEYNVFALRYSGDSHSDTWRVDIDGIRWGTKPDTRAVSTPSNGKLIWGARVSEAFRAKVIGISSGLSFDPNWLMAVMGFETGFTFSPSVRNPGSSATGLIQFMQTTAIGLGTTTAKLARMTAVEQLDYVQKYYDAIPASRVRNLGDAYLAVLFPPGIGRPDSYVMWQRDAGPYQREYAANSGLDRDKKGYITRGDAVAVVNNSYREGGKYAR